MWYGADCGGFGQQFYFQAGSETEALGIAERDFGTSELVATVPVVLGEFVPKSKPVKVQEEHFCSGCGYKLPYFMGPCIRCG